jgi:flagellar protein FlaG
MNDMKLTPVASPVVSRPVSSKGGEVDNAVQAVGKTLPLAAAEKQPAPMDKRTDSSPSDQLQKAVVAINEYVQSINRDLQFSVDEETERTVIKVIDSESGELIRQIPDEIFLELARKLNDDGGFQLIDALG